MSFHLKKVQNQQWVWILEKQDNKILISSHERYATRQACLNAIALLQKSIQEEVVETIKKI